MKYRNENIDKKNCKMPIHSVTLIPYIPGRGFIICDEMRKCFPDKTKKELKTHFIGGKVEVRDKNPLNAACREWCEELPFIYNHLSIAAAIKAGVNIHRDIVVSKHNNLKNRFYIFDVSSLKNAAIRDSFYNAVDHFAPNLSLLSNVYYWNGITRLPNISSLFEKFMSELILNEKFLAEHGFKVENNKEDELFDNTYANELNALLVKSYSYSNISFQSWLQQLNMEDVL